MSGPIETRVQTRSDLAWSITVGGIGIIAFAAFLLFAWTYAATLFLVFAGILLGVALTAMTHLLQKVMGGPHALRLALVALVFVGGAVIGVYFVMRGDSSADRGRLVTANVAGGVATSGTFENWKGVINNHFNDYTDELKSFGWNVRAKAAGFRIRDMDAIMAVARTHGLKVVEDAACALGRRRGRPGCAPR